MMVKKFKGDSVDANDVLENEISEETGGENQNNNGKSLDKQQFDDDKTAEHQQNIGTTSAEHRYNIGRKMQRFLIKESQRGSTEIEDYRNLMEILGIKFPKEKDK